MPELKNMSSEGKIVLVAGGTGGLGQAVSKAFLNDGADLIVTFRNEQELVDLKRFLGETSSRLIGRKIDVTDEAAVQGFMDQIASERGRLDVLVNTVGGYVGGIKLWDLDTRLFDQMLNLNLRSGYVLARAAVRLMLKAGRGAIVNIASKAAVDHAAEAGAYAASKAAAVALMDSLAGELRGSGVRVNSILPSIIDTPVNRKMMPQADYSKWPKPEEIARVVLFLCGDDSKVIHGAAIPVYGNSG